MSRKCPLIFMKDFAPIQIDYLNLPAQIKNELFYFNKDRNVYRCKIPSRMEMKSYLKSKSLDMDIAPQLSAIYDAATHNLGDFTLAIEQNCKEGQQLVTLINDYSLSRFSLTSVGIVIGIKYYEQTSRNSLNFDSWFNDEFSRKIIEKIH